MFKNIFEGKQCFVLGNGRSITEETLNAVKNEITIGVNGIAFAKSLWNFEPSFLCLTDYQAIINETRKAINNLICPIFVSEFVLYQAKYIYGIEIEEEVIAFLNERCYMVRWLKSTMKFSEIFSDDELSFDLEKGTVMCGTVIQDLAIPIASWFGCKNIYLLGCDCNENGRFYDEKGVKSHLADRIPIQYNFFQEKLKKENKNLYNLSPSLIPNVSNCNIYDISDKPNG